MNVNEEDPRFLFQPAFGNRPEKFIGRDGVIEQFIDGPRVPGRLIAKVGRMTRRLSSPIRQFGTLACQIQRDVAPDPHPRTSE